MITFRILNPLIDYRNKELFNVDMKITKYKNLLFQFNFEPKILIEFDLDIRCDCDHPGAFLNITLLGVSTIFEFYDGRHWNYDENRYMTEQEVIKDEQKWKEVSVKNKLFKEHFNEIETYLKEKGYL